MVTYMIVDDERPNRVLLKALLTEYNTEFELIGEAENGASAVEQINELKPQVVFLDIQMRDFNGFEVIAQLNHKPYIVFVTAYENYAIKAFEESAIDYLVKPVEENRLLKTLTKIKKLQQEDRNIDFSELQKIFEKATVQKTSIMEHIAVKQGAKILLLNINDVCRFEGKEKYVAIYTKEGMEYLTNQTLTELEPALPSQFLRVQKGIILNINFISEIVKYANNRLTIKLKDVKKTEILTGTSYRQQIKIKIGV
jgi:two-component system, LytTR family, response regulator